MQTRRSASSLALLISSALFLGPLGLTSAGAAEYLPDSLVKKGKPSADLTSYRGFGTFSPKGEGETVRRRGRIGGKATFSFGYYNAGDVLDTLEVRGCRGKKGLRVSYFIQGLSSTEYDVDVTDQVVAGMAVGSIAPGVGSSMLVKVKIPSGASPGQRWSCKFRVSSLIATSSYDVSRWKLQLRR